jgi:hypothetical protein
LFAHEGRERSGDTANLGLYDEVHGPPCRVAGQEGLFTGWRDQQLDEARLRSRGDHRDGRQGRVGRDVLHQRENEAVGDVQRQVQMLGQELVLSIFVRVSNPNFLLFHVNLDVDGMQKGRSLLNEMVVNQAEVSARRVDDRLVMQRAVLEVKHEPTRHSITPSELDQLTISEQAPLERAQGKKAVDKALRVAHHHGLRAHLFRWNEKSAAEQCSDEGTATVFDEL